ncbi:MAG: enoyl-CoA hydratase/isomerase family protein [Rhizobiaceae bacterium]|nr:enoyl-CoA hydratase/isomerase family protein [Rhizobiaceae bacterium]
MLDVLTREDFDGIASLTLNRPEVRNALTPESFRLLRRHVDDIAARTDAIGCVLLSAAGESFCAGFDMKSLKANDAAEPRSFRAETITALANLPQPVIVIVRGHCFTGGLELALAGDIIVAGESAIFCDSHSRLGMTAGWGLPQRLSRRIGLAAAKEMMFTSRRVSGQEAGRIGLANHVVPDDTTWQKAMELARAIVSNARESVLWTKRMLDGGIDMPLAEALAWEQDQKPKRGADFATRIDTQRA